MPITDIKSTDLKPTIQAKPNMRFGTTFLSTKYRQYAVNGESIMDKATGEIFTRRTEDGRVVSFFQNKKYMHDLMLELRVLLNNNPAFLFPRESETAYYISRDYDLVYINDEKLNNLMENNVVIPNTDESYHQMNFRISKNSNGFFIRLMSRDTDKATINFLSSQYNQLLSSYTGTDSTILAEKGKLSTIDKWKDSDVTISYTLTISKGGKNTTYSLQDYIRVNEETCLLLPQASLEKDFPDGYDYAEVEINSFVFTKLHFMVQYGPTLDPNFNNELAKFQYLDKNIFINYCNICCFVDTSTDINLLGNEFIISFVDVPYVLRYMAKMAKLTEASDFITSPQRPDPGVWAVNALWAEQVRDVYGSGQTIERACEVDIDRLEHYLAKDTGTHSDVIITPDTFRTDDIWIFDPSVHSYTTEEVDAKMASLHEYISGEAAKIVTDDSNNVTDNGMVVETTSEDIEE